MAEPNSGEMPRSNILGVGINPTNIPATLQIMDEWIARAERQYICVTGMHGVMESQSDEELRAIHQRAGLVVPDGMPMVWLSRLQGFQQVQRVYGPDLMLAMCAHSVQKGHRHFLYGGAPGVAQLLAQRLRQRFPGICIVGTISPPFRPLSPEEIDSFCEQINQSQPDIVWLGLGTPRQEYWMAAQRPKLQAAVLIGVGAAFDFHSGLKKQAPRWMQESGLEWFYRLLQEPQRLWRRYLLNIPRFLWLVFLQISHLRNFEMPEIGRN